MFLFAINQDGVSKRRCQIWEVGVAAKKQSIIDLSAKRMLMLGTASGLAICTVLSGAAFAQEEPVDQVEEAVRDEAEDEEDVIVVQGFRRSLQNAQDIKENADTFVDAITAEDIGALPDRSVAEALQRIPGVNISRFAKTTDPDRFSVEGAGVVIRGLPFVRSELNGRDIFSANGGRELSFNDVSPELLGGVEVYKNATADMIDGGISGTVNLVTRKPLDNPGLNFAGTVEANYGDLAKEWSPAFSVLGSNTWETNAGRFGIQLGYAQSELITRTDASQVTDPCFRASTLDGPCIRLNDVGSGGVSGDPNFTEDNFPPAGTVLAPKGAGIRTTQFDRDRQAFSAIAQWESPDRRFLATFEFLRAEADLKLDEYAILALVNDDNLFAIPGSPWTFDSNGVFQSGVLTQISGRGGADCAPGSLNPPLGGAFPCNPQVGISTENLRFQREDDAKTQDFSLDLKWNPTDRLSINLEGQHITSDRNENALIAAMQTYSDIFVDIGGDTPIVEFRTPATTDGSSDANFFTNPDRTFYWFLLDNQIRNTGELTSFRGDVDYEIGEGFIKAARFGARWADRKRETQDDQFANWGNLSAPWLGNSQWTSDFPASSGVRNPFAEFQRGEGGSPLPGGEAIFYGGDNLVSEYLSGVTQQQADEIIIAWENTFGFWDRSSFGPFPTSWRPIVSPRAQSDVGETTLSFYGRVDFGSDGFLGTGLTLDGNAGVRYVRTTVQSDGAISFPPTASAPPPALCDPMLPGGLPGFCSLSPARTAEFLSVFTGEMLDDNADIKFDHILPSFNAKLGITDEFLFRFGISKGISRPDLAAFATGGVLIDNTNNLRDAGTLDTGPLFQLFTGNRLLRPIESLNVDLSAEWYFDDVGSLTFSVFRKYLDNNINRGVTLRDFTSPSGVTTTVQVTGPSNVDEGVLEGFEFAYQQTYDFLPGPLQYLGSQITYTYVDGGEFSNPNLNDNQGTLAAITPFAGISDHTVNATVFYEDSRVSARLAYNWRSEFLLTARDDIFPFAPIFGEATGQLDGSIFYSVSEKVKLGVQAVNILDEVTKTSYLVDFDNTQFIRSAFRNDRRFTFLARWDF